MPTILERFDKKEPRYPTRFRDRINNRTADRLSRKRAFDTSVGAEEEKYAKGKRFANYYGCFLYATIPGIRQNYRLSTFRMPPFGLDTSPA